MTSTAKLQNFQHAHLELDLNKVLFAPDDKGIIQYEIWKDIPEYEGHYQVSSFGRVKSLERKVKRGNHFYYVKEKILRQSNPQTYLLVTLKKDNTEIKPQVHQLVTMAFLNHKPNGFKKVVDHKNNISTQNYLWNLQVITNRKNCSKDKKGGTSEYVGVSWKSSREKWRALIYHNGKDVHLGFFNDEKEASKYYQNALKAIQEGKPIQIKRRTPKNKHKGIHQVKSGRFALRIGKKHIGTYDTEEEALKVRDKILNNKTT